MRQAREAEATHQRNRPEEIDHVVDIEAVTRTLLVADAGQRAVQTVAQPIERDAHDHTKQGEAVGTRESIAETRSNLRQ